jgi:hypothetical protein
MLPAVAGAAIRLAGASRAPSTVRPNRWIESLAEATGRGNDHIGRSAARRAGRAHSRRDVVKCGQLGPTGAGGGLSL